MSEKEINKIIAKNLLHQLEINNKTQQELAKYMGVSQATVSNWCKGIKLPRMSKVDKICEFFKINRSDLLEDNRLNPYISSVHYRLPVLTTVAAGKPIFAEEDIIEWIDYDKDPGDHIRACRIDGTSMIPRIQDGDIVIFDRDLGWEDGDVVIATVNGDHATCKRIKRYADGIALISDNTAIAPMYFSKSEVEDLPVRIIGRVVEVRGRL